MSAVHVCPSRDIECGTNAAAWCAKCPKRQEPTFSLLQHLQRQREFSERTFGPGLRTQGVVDHIRKELIEVLAKPTDLGEWIDVAILALDGAWRTGATPEEIIAGLVTKQSKNEGRDWPDWRQADPNKAIQHDRKSEAVDSVEATNRVHLAAQLLLNEADAFDKVVTVERVPRKPLAMGNADYLVSVWDRRVTS